MATIWVYWSGFINDVGTTEALLTTHIIQRTTDTTPYQ